MIKVDLKELKEAIASIEARTNTVLVTVKIEDRKMQLTAIDKSDNILSITLFDEGSMAAQIMSTERLMFQKK
jgi:hypothetical protein